MLDNSPLPDLQASAWAQTDAIDGADEGFAHHGLALTASGEVISFHAGQLVAFGPDGEVRRTMPVGLTEGHGLTLVEENGRESLWIADPGFAIACGTGTGDGKLPPTFGTGLDLTVAPGRVVKVSLDGAIDSELPTPPCPEDAPGPFAPYAPTSVAVEEPRFGGSGDIWVADGYGSNAVHRFDASGRHLLTLTGAEGAGRFDCPHAVFIRRSEGREPELYVADRGNARIAVYDLSGTFQRVVGADVLNSPTGFTVWNDLLVVVELFARLTLLDAEDQLVGYLGEDPAAVERAGWPNALHDHGAATRPPLPGPGVLNSPHSAAVNPKGELLVAEWLLGGRYTKFSRNDG
jgi:hypothetical protein